MGLLGNFALQISKLVIIKEQIKKRSSIGRLWQYITVQRRWQLGVLFVIMLIASIVEVISIGAVLPFLGALMSPDKVFAYPNMQLLLDFLGLSISKPEYLLFPLTVFFILAAMLSGYMRWLLLWAQTRLGYAIGSDISNQIYRKTLYQPYSVHVARNTSQIISGISSKANNVVSGAVLPLLTMVSSGLILTAILMALMIMNPVVAMVTFGGFGGIYGLIIIFAKKRLAEDSARISLESTRVIKVLQEGLGGIRDVLIDGTQAIYCKIYQAADSPLRKSQASVQLVAGTPRFVAETLGMVIIAVLAYAMARDGDGIAAAIPMLGALALGAQRMLPTMQQIYSSWSVMRGGRSSLQDVIKLLDQPLPENADGLAPFPLDFKKSIRCTRLSYQYSENAPWILRDINIDIPKGSRVGFIGATGSGKSTLVDLIMGLLIPTEGGLEIDGVNVTLENYRAWQAHIAHVPQAIFLADTSVCENIAFGVPLEKINFSLVKSAAKQAQIATTIESWERQYDTLVGERGVRLSGGQRQRIGIARALYKRADVIVFDEATSALDMDTERAVMEAINQISRDITILIVAHRLTTLQSCDLIFDLKNGRLTRSGDRK